MSKRVEFLQIFPDNYNKTNRGEVHKIKGFDCPDCKGDGFFNNSGYMEKFKKNLSDPNFEECPRCKGTGKLEANVVIGWVPENGPSKCPQEQ